MLSTQTKTQLLLDQKDVTSKRSLSIFSRFHHTCSLDIFWESMPKLCTEQKHFRGLIFWIQKFTENNLGQNWFLSQLISYAWSKAAQSFIANSFSGAWQSLRQKTFLRRSTSTKVSPEPFLIKNKNPLTGPSSSITS